MYFASSAVAAALLIAPRLVSAGSAIVRNSCPFDIYVTSVDNTPGQMHTIPAGGEFTEPYKLNIDGGGISLKVSPEEIMSEIAQFEYTLLGSIWYDLSLINGQPFSKYGITLTPSDSDCPRVNCPPGEQSCSDAYMIPTDDHATKACSSEANIVMDVCSSNSSNGSSDSEKKVPSSPDPSSSPAAPASPVTTTAVQAEQSSAPGGGVYTTFVTQVLTIAAREATPVPKPHAHMHHHRHADVHAHA